MIRTAKSLGTARSRPERDLVHAPRIGGRRASFCSMLELPTNGAAVTTVRSLVLTDSVFVSMACRRLERSALLAGAGAALLTLSVLEVAMPALETEKNLTALARRIDRERSTSGDRGLHDIPSSKEQP